MSKLVKWFFSNLGVVIFYLSILTLVVSGAVLCVTLLWIVLDFIWSDENFHYGLREKAFLTSIVMVAISLIASSITEQWA